MNRLLFPSPSLGHDLIPWADPYIVSLVKRLKARGGRLLNVVDSASRQGSAPRFLAEAVGDLPADCYFGEDWGCDDEVI